MPRYKRTAEEAGLDVSLEAHVEPANVETLTKLRNMWEFSSFMQYIFLFGHVVKVSDDFDIEDLEAECLRPQPSQRLAAIGLALLKYVSSHRGLTPEIFDEYTRRQYEAKAPLRSPYGDEDEPANFNDFDIFTKIKVLQQLSTWTLGNADRIRGMMPQDDDHLNWRMEPLGWDKEDRAYFVLDDNRLYRRTDEPPPPPTPPQPKAKSKVSNKKSSKSKGTRTSKRRKVEEVAEDEAEEVDGAEDAQDETVMTNGEHAVPEEEPGFGFTSKTWECIAITLDEYQDFLASIFRSRDANEKQLRKRIEEDVLPVIEKRAEALRQKQMKKMRELENMQKLATAKRSGRLADKAEKDKQDREEREVEEKKQADLRMAHEEQDRQKRIEEGHESRRLTREQRVKEREVKRILHEEELTKIEEHANRASSQDPASDAAAESSSRISDRQMKTKREQVKKELAQLAEDEDKWVFDCYKCGMHGENLDDGTHSIACERCSVWQHSKCHGFSPKQAEKDGFHFICVTCKRKETDAKKPKIPPLKLGKNRQSASPETQRATSRPSTANGQTSTPLPDHVARQLDNVQYYYPPNKPAGPFGQITNGPSLSPYGQAQGPPGYRYPPVGNFAPHPPHPHPPPQQMWQDSSLPAPGRPPSSGYAGSPPPPSSIVNGYGAPDHQQHHQQAHQYAMVSSGGHPSYPTPQQPQQAYGYSPRVSGGQMYPIQPMPPQHQQYYQQPPYDQRQPPYQQPPPPRPGSGHLQNGFQSPVKNGARPSHSPPQHQHQPHPPYGQPHHHQPIQSPVNFAPHQPLYPQQGSQSPVKSSPPGMHQQQPVHQRPTQPSPAAVQPPHNYRTPYANGNSTAYQTPQQAHPSPAGANANAVAADGMSGPWPESSKAIPQKHDQSPAPPASSQPGGDAKVMPPVALVPSPSQQIQAATTGPQSVPVKKMPEVTGAPAVPTLQLAQVPPSDVSLGKTPELNGAPAQNSAQVG